jgi:hypothetical protein
VALDLDQQVVGDPKDRRQGGLGPSEIHQARRGALRRDGGALRPPTRPLEEPSGDLCGTPPTVVG